MKTIAICLLLSVSLLLPHAVLRAEAQQNPKETVQAHVDAVLKTLKTTKSKQQQRAEIIAQADRLFDFVELSKRTLGLSWNKFSQDQRREFVDLYKGLLEDTYIDRITAYSNEKVTFADAVPLGQNTMEVRSTVQTKTGPVSINYRVINENGQWKVYDVVIAGVSLIANYRSQFREILINQSPEGLLDTLRHKEGGSKKES
jgi:phospholipid transport system substrate-binding protein